MRIGLYHGYELMGSGSNEYTRYLAASLLSWDMRSISSAASSIRSSFPSLNGPLPGTAQAYLKHSSA